MAEQAQADTYRQVGILIDGIEFVRQEIVERHLPFAVPPGVEIQAVFVRAGGDDG